MQFQEMVGVSMSWGHVPVLASLFLVFFAAFAQFYAHDLVAAISLGFAIWSMLLAIWIDMKKQ